MTLKLMQGFESMRDDTDFRAQNWIQAPTKMTAGFPPSISSVAGTSMKLIGAGSASTAATGAAGAPDLGYFNTGVTVNQAWLAGGFALGFNAKFNSGITATYGSGSGNNSSQVCFDGTKYWAIQLIGSSYTIATSTDLKTWTTTPTQPAVTMDSVATLFYMGGNTIAMIRSVAATTSLTVYYTSNNGASWTGQQLGVGSGAADTIGTALATGNATYPHAIMIAGDGGNGAIYVGTLGGTFTNVVTIAVDGTVARPRALNGLLMFTNYASSAATLYTATAANASLNTSGAWSSATFVSGVSIIEDIAYSPISNLWVIATFNGIWTFPNLGAPGTPVAPTGAQTATQRYSTVQMQNVHWTGTQLVATGMQGHIITSPDGITWTESGGHIIPVGTSGIDWRCTLYDGSRYVMFSDATTGVIATTPDLVTNYQAQYIADGTENRNGANTYGAIGVYSGTAPAASTGLWTANVNGFVIVPGATSGGARPVTMYYLVNGTEAAGDLKTGSVPTNPSQHYYELVATATTTANTFLISVYVDGAPFVSDTTGRLQGASTTDTTSLLILVPNRTGSFLAVDDMYFTLQDGSGLSGRLGPVSMIAETPATDVQAQWVKNGSAASNSLTVAGPALSSNHSNYLTSQNPGDKDIYNTSVGVIPSGYVVKAVQAEAVFTKVGTSPPVVSVGISSGGTESDSANLTVSASGATYLTQIYPNDPHGNVAWTNASANAAELVINHVS